MWKWVRVVFLELPRILWIDLFYLIRYSRHPEKYPLEKRYKVVRNLIVHLLRSYHGYFKIENEEILKKATEGGKKVLLVSNHLSFTDSLSMIAASEQPLAFVAKKDTYKMFVVGRCARAIGCLFMDRSDLRQSLQIIRSASNLLKDGTQNVLIFPEGTRNKDLNAPLLEMHPGSLKAGTMAKASIVVFASFGNHRILDKEHNYKRHLLHYKYLEVITPEEYSGMETVELISKIRDTLQAGVNELRDYDKKFIEDGKHKIPLRKGDID